MKRSSRGTGQIWDSLGSHAVDEAERSAPGPGLYLKYTRFCVSCVQDVNPKGGRVIGDKLFQCAGCRPKAAPA